MREKEIFQEFISSGLSTTQISKKLGISQTCVRYWLKKFNLVTKPLYQLKNRFKYSDEELLEIWIGCDSINQFLLKLGVGTSGGAWYHYRKRLKTLGVDISQSTKNGRSRGGNKTAEIRNKLAIKKCIRLPRTTLKKSMDLAGIRYECNNCKIFEWKGKKIKLHIHHKNKNKNENEISNLEYLCPNCHSIEHFQED